MYLETVKGRIPTEKMGITLSHEHVYVGSGDMVAAFGDAWVNRKELVKEAARQLQECQKAWRISTMLDGTATDTARDVTLIREVAEESGIQIAYCTGLYHTEAQFIKGKRPEEFAKYFIRECREGSAGTNCKPAFLKCATGARGITPLNRIEVATMAVTQRETGLPLFCHNEHRIHTATEQIKIFREYGADLSRVIIGHASDTADVEYLWSLYQTGVWLSFDRIGPRADGGLRQAKTLAALIERGADRLLVSHDHCVYLDFGNISWEKVKARGYMDKNLDFGFVFRSYFPLLRQLGVSEETLRKLVIENPAQAYGSR